MYKQYNILPKGVRMNPLASSAFGHRFEVEIWKFKFFKVVMKLEVVFEHVFYLEYFWNLWVKVKSPAM